MNTFYEHLLRPFSADTKLGDARRSQLDCLYARVASSLDKLLQAVGLKKPPNECMKMRTFFALFAA